MEKLKKATKRITAVGASALMVSSAAFGAGLSDYPQNFVKDGKFNGQIVVGSSSAAIDTTSANSIISDLKSEFSGETQKVKIVATKSSSGGDSVSIADSGKTLNYGENIGDVRSSSLDDTDLPSILSDETFNNGADDQDYTQTLQFDSNTGVFEHNLRNDFETEISDHIYMPAGDVVTYTLEFKSPVTFDDQTSGQRDKDFVGKKLKIMGQEFTVTKVSSGFSSMELIGGSSQVTLGEGESTKVTVDGKEYDITLSSVSSSSSTTQVLITINGETNTIDQYDTEDVGGITVGVVDALPSSRDSVKGYASLVLGGNKVKLDGAGGEIKLNDKTISDIYDNYVVTSNITVTNAGNSSAKLEKIVLQYRLDDDTILKAGQAWEDKVFNAFSLKFEGTNNPTYKTVKIEESNDRLKVAGDTIDGKAFDEDIAKIVDDTNTNSFIHLIGKNDDDSFLVVDFSPSALPTPLVSGTPQKFQNEGLEVSFVSGNVAAVNLTVNGVSYNNKAVGTPFNVGNWRFNVTGANGSQANVSLLGVDLANANGFRVLVGDKDNQELYGFKTYTVSSKEQDVEDILTGNTRDNVAEKNIGTGKITDLTSTDTTEDGLLTNVGGTYDSLAMDGNLMVNLSGVNNDAGTSKLTITLDSSDLNADDEPSDFSDSTFDVTLNVDTTDNEFDLSLPSSLGVSYANSGQKPDVTDSNSDVQEWVTKYGVKVRYDNKEKRFVEISVPNKQVEANLKVVAGTGSSQQVTKTVDKDMLESEKQALIDDGYTIVSTEDVASEKVEFDVTAPVMDSDVTGTSNMIVVGGPAVNKVAAELLGMSFPTYGEDSGVGPGEAVIRYFSDANSVLVYGYEGTDTKAAVEKLNNEVLSGTEVSVS